MDTGEDIVPAFARIKNSIRIIAEDVSTADKKLSFVVNVILGEFGRVQKEEILAIQDYPKRGVFDVTFTGEGIFSSVLQILADNKKDPRLTGYRIFPHVPEEIILVAKSYSPLVPQREIDLVLSKYCDKLTFSGKILNELGIWTSKYKYKAKFKKGVYPPARFRLGNVNLDCHFNGMPIFCRKCRAYGHSMEDCNSCTNCGELSHAVKDCLQAKKCFLCFQFGHLYASCPMREKQENREEEMVVPMEHFAASPDLGDLSASPNLVIFSDGFSDVSSQCSQKKVEFIPVEQG
uniref:CCHC-type domain-containing protein n=1 Tax=Xenopus tropicalis TaxID=8364 RepID=A0A803J3N2_XENTR